MYLSSTCNCFFCQNKIILSPYVIYDKFDYRVKILKVNLDKNNNLSIFGKLKMRGVLGKGGLFSTLGTYGQYYR